MPENLSPLRSFSFEVEIVVNEEGEPLCNASFAECDGMEVTMEVKTIRQGGDNGRQIKLTGPLAFGTLTLKRGMTTNFDLWRWVMGYSKLAGQRKRAQVKVAITAADTRTPQATFLLSRCVPIKLKAPPLNAKDGIIAVEELQIAYESILLQEADA